MTSARYGHRTRREIIKKAEYNSGPPEQRILCVLKELTHLKAPMTIKDIMLHTHINSPKVVVDLIRELQKTQEIFCTTNNTGAVYYHFDNPVETTESDKPSLSEQTKKLVDEFPIGCIIRCVAENIKGRVTGYRQGAHIDRRDEMAMTIDVPGDTWIVYPDQIEKDVVS